MAPKVSVLIPAYNHEQYIRDTINSVINQTFEDFELLIYDDCSTDNTAEIIKSFSDKRITAIFPDKNSGTVSALNNLLKIAKGEYIAVLGSDDIWVSDKLERQLEIMENNPSIAACFSNAEIIDKNSDTIAESSVFPIDIFNYTFSDKASVLCDFFMSGNKLCHSSALIRADVHKQIGIYNPAYRQLHDFDLWVRLILKYDIHILDSKLVRYRFVQNSDNVSRSNTANDNRLFNEGKSIIRFLIDNISDEDFISGFSKYLQKTDVKDPAEIICEKFLLLKNYGLWGTASRSLMIDYVIQNLNDEVVNCFSTNYDISLNDIYGYTGEISDKQNETYLRENAELKRQLNDIYSSKMWKVITFFRKIFTS